MTTTIPFGRHACNDDHTIPQEVAWAATQEVTEGGTKTTAAVGPACMDCWDIGVNILGFECWKDFKKEYDRKDSLVPGKVEKVKQRRQKPNGEVEWKQGTVSCSTGFTLEFSKEYRAYSELSLRSKVDATRLSKKAMADVPAVTGPSLDAPGDDCTYYLFPRAESYPPSDDGVDVRVVATRTYDRKEQLLARNRCEYDQHAKDKLIRDLKAHSGVSGAKDMMRAGKPLTLQEFMESYEGHVRGRKTASGKKDSKPAITGPAASEFEVEDEEVTEKVEENLNADLTDQLVKNKPEAPGKTVAPLSQPQGAVRLAWMIATTAMRVSAIRVTRLKHKRNPFLLNSVMSMILTRPLAMVLGTCSQCLRNTGYTHGHEIL